MNGRFTTAVSLVTAIVDHSNRRKAKRKINRLNERNRNIQLLGNVSSDQLIPCSYQMGNISISGGSETIRNELIIQNCKQSASVGIPTIIIHDGNYHLEQMLQSSFPGHRYLRIINPSNPYYDPLFRLNELEIGHFVSEASLKDHPIDSSGALYVKALSAILRKRGITPYTRMFSHCPHGEINNMIAQMEQSGILTTNEAGQLRSDVSVGSKAQADVDYFFHQLELESPILPWKSHLSRCTSISECILRNGIMAIDVSSCRRLNQLALISTEIEHCARTGTPFRMIIDAVSFSCSEKLIQALKGSFNSAAWTISSPDMNRMLGNTQSELATWLALSHRAILFTHGIKTCELFSAELGEYEHIDMIESRTGNNNLGRLGYHYGAYSSFTTSANRARIIQPEEIELLGLNGFIMLDNYTATISKGKLI